MTFDHFSEDPSEFDIDALDIMLGIAAGVIVRDEDPAKFQRWIANSAPYLVPDLFDQLVDEPARRAFIYGLGRSIWDATPLPGHEYQPSPLPKPGRNDPCPCGSSQKFKRCCAGNPFPDSLIEPQLMLAKVLDTIPTKAFRELPYRKLSLQSLAAVAQQWRDNGDTQRAKTLLEPIFTDSVKLDERAEYAFDVLCDCYDELYHPRKKRMLVEKLVNGANRGLRSTALQRLTTMLADEGKIDEAWQYFREAQRAFPDDPNLSTLEVLLLTNQGKPELARERARYWIARLKRDKDRDLDDLIEFLQNIVSDNSAAMFDMSAKHTPALGELKDLLDNAPPVARGGYDIEFDEHEYTGVLIPSKALLLLEKRWQSHVPVGKPALTSLEYFEEENPWELTTAHMWLGFLKANPRALGSFDILDDIVQCVRHSAHAHTPWLTDQLLRPLLARAETLLTDTIKAYDFNKRSLPWMAMDNRPALRLFTGMIYLDLDAGRLADALPRMETMVYKLNPMDNHGMRANLMEAYLRQVDYEKALALTAKFPGDGMPDLEFGTVVALYGLNRRDEAARALAEARNDSPLIVKYLTAKNPRQPKFSDFGITVDGKDEAWIYRTKYLDIWQSTGAFELLKSTKKQSVSRKNTTKDISGI